MARFISHSFQLANTHGASLKGSIHLSFLWHAKVAIRKRNTPLYNRNIREPNKIVQKSYTLNMSFTIFIGIHVMKIAHI